MSRPSRFLAVVALAGSALAAQAATIRIVNGEPAGVGFGSRVHPVFHPHADWTDLRMALDG